MVGHHQAADSVGRGQVRGLPGQSHLDAGRTPRNEAGKFSLPDPLEAFVHLQTSQWTKRWSGLQNANPRRIPESTDAASFYLCGVNLSLDDVEDGDVAVARLPLSPRGHHHVLGLQKPPHHIQHGGFSHAGDLQSKSGPVSTLNVSSV